MEHCYSFVFGGYRFLYSYKQSLSSQKYCDNNDIGVGHLKRALTKKHGRRRWLKNKWNSVETEHLQNNFDINLYGIEKNSNNAFVCHAKRDKTTTEMERFSAKPNFFDEIHYYYYMQTACVILADGSDVIQPSHYGIWAWAINPLPRQRIALPQMLILQMETFVQLFPTNTHTPVYPTRCNE